MVEQTTLEYENTQNEDRSLILYTVQGIIVKTLTHITNDTLLIKRGNLPAGLYYFVLRTSDRILGTGKLVIH